MGTRSHTNFIEVTANGSDLICSVYQQYDGYLSYVGKNIADFLAGKEIVNGYNSLDATKANGIGCLAAQFIAKFKDGIGNLYIIKPQESNMVITGWIEYIYNIYVDDSKEGADQYRIEVIDCDGKIFDGNLDEYVAFIQNAINEENEE